MAVLPLKRLFLNTAMAGFWTRRAGRLGAGKRQLVKPMTPIKADGRGCSMTNHPNRSRTNYVVVAAPGYYGDRTVVQSTHRTLEAARRAAGNGHYAIYRSTLGRGTEWLRVYCEGSRVEGI